MELVRKLSLREQQVKPKEYDSFTPFYRTRVAPAINQRITNLSRFRPLYLSFVYTWFTTEESSDISVRNVLVAGERRPQGSPRATQLAEQNPTEQYRTEQKGMNGPDRRRTTRNREQQQNINKTGACRLVEYTGRTHQRPHCLHPPLLALPPHVPRSQNRYGGSDRNRSTLRWHLLRINIHRVKNLLHGSLNPCSPGRAYDHGPSRFDSTHTSSTTFLWHQPRVMHPYLVRGFQPCRTEPRKPAPDRRTPPGVRRLERRPA